MNLLLDENLSPRLVSRLEMLFGCIRHVRDVSLQQASDEIIWTWAQQNGHIIVTADSDFLAISQRRGFPPKVIYVEHCDFPYRVLEDLLRRNAVRISEFERDAKASVLMLRTH